MGDFVEHDRDECPASDSSPIGRLDQDSMRLANCNRRMPNFTERFVTLPANSGMLLISAETNSLQEIRLIAVHREQHHAAKLARLECPRLHARQVDDDGCDEVVLTRAPAARESYFPH